MNMHHDASRHSPTDPAPPLEEDDFPLSEPPTNRGKQAPPGFAGTPAPVPPPGSDLSLEQYIARMEASIGEVRSELKKVNASVQKMDATFDEVLGQVQSFHREVYARVQRHEAETEQRFKELEDRMTKLEERSGVVPNEPTPG